MWLIIQMPRFAASEMLEKLALNAMKMV